MMFSKACEYGIKACVYIALQSLGDQRVTLGQIAKDIDTPEAFTAKVLHQLAKNGILDSAKGPKGGFKIQKGRLSRIMIQDIVFVIDGDSLFKGCPLGFTQCNGERPCPLHDRFTNIRGDLQAMLGTTSLFELALGLKEGITYMVP